MKQLEWVKGEESHRGAEAARVGMIEFTLEREFVDNGDWLLFIYTGDESGDFGGEAAYCDSFKAKTAAKARAQKIVDSIAGWANETT